MTRGASPVFNPILVGEVELADGPLRIDVPLTATGGRYPSARLLVRLHRRPLGLVTIPVVDEQLDEHAGDVIWRELGDAIREHLTADGYATTDTVPVAVGAAAPCARVSPQRVADLTVVVPTCNRLSTLLPCLDSVLASSVAPLEVIVVENRPAGSRVADALKSAYPNEHRIRYLEEPAPGVSHARNRGLAAARGAIVAFVDDDVIVDIDWLASIVLAFAEHPEASCVTGQILPLELEWPAQLWIEQYGGFSKGFERVVFDTRRQRVDPLYPYTVGKCGSGANAAFRSDVARSLGGFDVVLGGAAGLTSGEDLDLFLRLMLAGHTLLYEPSALVWHRHRASLGELRHQLFQYGKGLAAVMTKQLVAGPRRRELIWRLPIGFGYLLSPRSGKNSHRQADYPRHLAALELLGMAAGPLAYLKSRYRSGALTAQ